MRMPLGVAQNIFSISFLKYPIFIIPESFYIKENFGRFFITFATIIHNRGALILRAENTLFEPDTDNADTGIKEY